VFHRENIEKTSAAEILGQAKALQGRVMASVLRLAAAPRQVVPTGETCRMPVASDLDATIATYATDGFTDATPLLEAGIDSLSLIRLAVEVVTDGDAEIDATRLVNLRTIGDLKAWLMDLAAGAC